jgi:hypothetical protein
MCAPVWALAATLIGSEAGTPDPAAKTSTVAVQSAKEQLVFSPAPMTRLHKRFALRHALVVKDSELLGGSRAQTQLDQMEIESGFWIRHFDGFKEMKDGHPVVFRRRFEDIRLDAQASMPSPQGPKNDSLFADSPLLGKSVVFTWRPEDGEYSRYYDVEEAGEEHLPGLAIDTSLVCLLPGEKVAPGDSWDIPLDGLRDLLGYGGKIDLVFALSDENDILLARNLLFGVGGSLWHAFEDPVKGTAKGTFTEVREVEGRRLAAVKVEIDIQCQVDQTELSNEKRNSIELTGGLVVEQAELRVGLKGTGEMLWDLDNNVPDGLNLVLEEDVYTSRIWAEREEPKPPILFPVMPSQAVTLIGVLRVDLRATHEEAAR